MNTNLLKTVFLVSIFILMLNYVAVAQEGDARGAGSNDTGGQSGSNDVMIDTRGSNESGQGQQTIVDQEAAGQNQGLVTQKMAKNTTELKEMIQTRTQEMSKEMEGMSTEQKNVYQNQNKVRTAVHTMLASENLVGGIGKDVSRIAKEFNNSVQSTIKAEESIQTGKNHNGKRK